MGIPDGLVKQLHRSLRDFGAGWKALAVLLLGLYLAASTLTAFPGFHDHASPTTTEDGVSTEGASHSDEDGHAESNPGAPGSHAPEDCQACQIQSTLGSSLLPSVPEMRTPILLPSHPLCHQSSFVPQILIAENATRGPPLSPIL